MEPHAATLKILDRLIGFPTVSADSNLGLIGYAEGLLQDAGFHTQRMPNTEGGKAGLVARLGADGPGGVLLSAHSDVVPVEGQTWTRPPFRLTREGDRLFGRGTTDMKGFLAAMLSAAGRAGNISQPLMLAISYDEEVGCRGIRQMMPEFAALGWQPDLCIVGEPTSMQPAIGHKGKAAYMARCRGVAGHSSMAPRYVNALHLAADFLAALRQEQQAFATGGVLDEAYDVPCSTVHAGRMQGGVALNIVPDHASLEFELRHLPQDDPDAFLARLRQSADGIIAPFTASHPEAGIEIEVSNSYPGLAMAADHPAVARVAALSGSRQITKVAYGTEAGYFAQLGFPTVVCGPGDMEGQGHKPDEYLSVGQLGECDRMMDRILTQLTPV